MSLSWLLLLPAAVFLLALVLAGALGGAAARGDETARRARRGR